MVILNRLDYAQKHFLLGQMIREYLERIVLPPESRNGCRAQDRSAEALLHYCSLHHAQPLHDVLIVLSSSNLASRVW